MKEIATCRKSRVRIATRIQKNTLKIHVIVRKSFDMKINISQRIDYDSVIKRKKGSRELNDEQEKASAGI